MIVIREQRAGGCYRGVARQVPRGPGRRPGGGWRAEHEPARHALLWTTPGAVWSVDFTRPSDEHGMKRIDGQFDRILLVRDLASRCTLLALPCSGERAEVVGPALENLFQEHGAPLVLKSDNGSAFIADSTGTLLRRHCVTHLRSPALTLQYNGSIESTGGCLKARVAEIAHRHGGGEGRCGWWSSDDIEAARLAGNTLNRPWGPKGPTPIERWQGRSIQPLSDAPRAAFQAAVERWRSRIERERAAAEKGNADAGTCEESSGGDRTEGGTGGGEGGGSGRRASVARAAIRQALIELGFLLVRSTAKISTDSPAVRGKD